MLIKVKIAQEVPGLFCPVLDTTPSSDPLAPSGFLEGCSISILPVLTSPRPAYENILTFAALTNPTS